MVAESWEIQASKHRFETYKGQQSLFIEKGRAFLKGANFTNGSIEFDIAFSEQRMFTGCLWRVQDGQNYEEFYMRPHQSGNPDANQYTPVFNGSAGWQLYHGEGYAKPYTYKFDEWMHVKIVVLGSEAEIFIEDMTTPLFRVNKLKRDVKSGTIGFSANGPFGNAHFANVNINYTDQVNLVSAPVRQAPTSPGTINSWEISTTFNAKQLENTVNIPKGLIKNSTWTTCGTEPGGTINLAKFAAPTETENTIFVKCTIRSDQKQIKALKFGYSDAVKVFCNAQLLYSGSNAFRTRDYRYLGTIGYFDTIYLPLEAGINEVWFAVSENMGGWAIKAQLEHLEGITVLEP